MIKFTMCLSIILTQCVLCFAQKRVLTVDECQSWPEVQFRPELSNDGKFAFYNLNKGNFNTQSYLHSMYEKWKMELQNLSFVQFSQDSKWLFGIYKSDTLITIDLITRHIYKTPNVQSYKLFMRGSKELVLTKQTRGKKNLSVGTLDGKMKFNSTNVESYVVANDGNSILFEKDTTITNVSKRILIWLDIDGFKRRIVYYGNNIKRLAIDNVSRQVAFFVKTTNENQIWYYNKMSNYAKLLVSDRSDYLKNQYNLDPSTGYWSFKFSENGMNLFFGLNEKVTNHNIAQETIRSYKDPYVNSYYQLSGNRIKNPISFASVSLKSNRILRLVNEDEDWVKSYFEKPPDKYIIIEKFLLDLSENNYNMELRRRSYYLRSTQTGESFPIMLNRSASEGLSSISLSPSGKYVSFYDKKFRRYCVYSVEKNTVSEVGIDVNESLIRYDYFNIPDSSTMLAGVIGWLPKDSALWINGRYNIWQLDPKNKKASINITASADLNAINGKQDSIVYYLPSNRYNISPSNDTIMLSAFNLRNKTIGFVNANLTKHLEYSNITFLPKYFPKCNGYNINDGIIFTKAKNSNIYLFRLESYSEAPNYYFTSNLKTYKPITDYQPHNQFNWYTTELHHYKDSVGNNLEGILYKPEDFDVTKRYPLILFYYENKSHELNEYVNPSEFQAINVPLFVSNGYLVFKPNIYSLPEKVGDGALKSVNAAADYLSKLKYVNSSKMGVSGHSFGGYETNYIVTHSHRFAAGISASGLSDLLEHYFRIDEGTRTGQLKMLKRPSDALNNYINNSPIFYVDSVTTPLLIMHNQRDNNVLYSQSFNFFSELRKLKKAVWMLSYENHGHALGGEALRVYNRKSLEFMNYYLKKQAMPDWMKRSN